MAGQSSERPLIQIIKEIMKTRGLKAKDVCDALGRGPSWFCQVQTGQTVPPIELLVKFAGLYAPNRLWELLTAAAVSAALRTKQQDKALKATAMDAWADILECARRYQAGAPWRLEGMRTLDAFPHAFYPMSVIVGDKREEAEDLQTAADVGAVSASQSELRWLLHLGLSRETDFISDKILVLESFEQLRERFGRRNLLVIGSGLCNHFARQCHLRDVPRGWRRPAPIHRFNTPQQWLADTDKIVRSLRHLSGDEFQAARHDPETVETLAFLRNNVLPHGIVDPAYRKFYLRASTAWHRDFGHITIARNPFSADDEFVCILAAGFHWRATAYALRVLADAAAGRKPFATHPFGGIIRATRTSPSHPLDQIKGEWDTRSDYTPDQLELGLQTLSTTPPPTLQATPEEFQETLSLVRALKGKKV